ncbi:hypothetical protein ACFYUV_27855 [Nonomuraea sp. NPDC003560]|uniref:hypothetical protein n=1 Tax=Nonomuraea sp. NPDC003560 TaxID=3364341 RepID=UPI0036750C52
MRRIPIALAALAAAGAVAMVPLATAQAATAVSLNAPMARAGEVITCQEVDAQLPDIFARACDTDHWGPLSDFVINSRDRAVYRCVTGWAEGSLWVRGQGCRRLQTS